MAPGRMRDAIGRHSLVKASVERVLKAANLLLGFFLRDAIALLDGTDQLIALTRNPFEIVVANFTPGLANLACDLLPIALNLIPIHRVLLEKT